MIAFLKRYLGWRNWSVLVYNSIIENIFVAFFIALSRQISVEHFIIDLFLFVCFSVFSTTYGFLVNDLADLDLDLRQGKSNTFIGDSRGKAAAIVVFFGMISVAFGLRFISHPGFLWLWLAWVLCATFYSVRPLRLKERGKAGLLVVVLAQRALPILLLFSAFRYGAWIEVLVLTVYVLFRGLSSDLNHQIADFRNDQATRTRTFAVEAGVGSAAMAFRISLTLEKVFLLASLAVMYLSASSLSFFGTPFFLPPLLAAIVMLGISCYKEVVRNEWTNPFDEGRKDLTQFLHHAFPSIVLPFYFLVPLMSWNWQFGGVAIVLVIYRRLYSADVILRSYPARMAQRLGRGAP